MRSMRRELAPLPSISASTSARSFSLPGPAAVRTDVRVCKQAQRWPQGSRRNHVLCRT